MPMTLPPWLHPTDYMAAYGLGSKLGQSAVEIENQDLASLRAARSRKEAAADRLQAAYNAIQSRETIADMTDRRLREQHQAANELRQFYLDNLNAKWTNEQQARADALAERTKQHESSLDLNERKFQFGQQMGEAGLGLKDRATTIAEGRAGEAVRHDKASEDRLNRALDDLIKSRSGRLTPEQKDSLTLAGNEIKLLQKKLYDPFTQPAEKPAIEKAIADKDAARKALIRSFTNPGAATDSSTPIPVAPALPDAQVLPPGESLRWQGPWPGVGESPLMGTPEDTTEEIDPVVTELDQWRKSRKSPTTNAPALGY